MSEFETIGDLFEADRHPTRPLEPIQKVDQVDQIERDIEEFYETPSAKTVLEETTEIVTDRGGQQRFRYVHATFGSGKSHLLKLIGVATGEIDGLEAAAHKLSNETTGFRAFRESLDESYIDHLHPLLMNLLDRDRQDASLPLLLFEELGRRRGYPTDRPWLLEFSWRLDITHDLWEPLQSTTVEDLTFDDIADRPTSLRAWLTEAIPQLDGAAEAGLDSAEAVADEIDAATAAVSEGSFTPEQLVERLVDTRSHLNDGTTVHEFLIGLDEIAIYVGDSPDRYQEVVTTIEALFEGVGCPIIGTGQWPLRDMQQKFVGDVIDEAWYTQEVKLEGADTETIVRKRWLQKSDDGTKHIKSEVLAESPPLEPEVSDPDAIADHDAPAEAYPFRDRDLGLLRAAMQGLIEGDRESERDYIQGRALLVRVRSLFDTHGWATREPGAIVSWDLLYDVLRADTALIPEWAHDLVERVGDSAEADPDVDATLAVRTTKALFLLSQLDFVPRTASTLARLLAQSVTVDLDQLEADVAEQLEALVEKNLIREDVDTSPTEYTILSEEDITFWQEVRQAAAEIPHPQFRANVQQYIQEAGSDRLTDDDIIDTADFGDYSDVPYTVRYTIDTSLSSSPTERHDALVVRLLAADSDGSENYIESWQETHSGPQGVEDVLVVINLPEGLRQQILQLIAMKQVLDSMADPRPKLRLQRQTDEETIEDEIAAQLESAAVYLPSRAGQYGEYLDDFEAAVAGRVDSKFPNRKTIETQIQQGDLQALIDFFEGGGSWPLTDRDAQTLGVNTVPRTIDNGWVADFLDSFEGEDRVSGERIVETINGRRGEFLGTPMNALHALLFVLVAAREIEVRADGERLTEQATIASHITRKGRLTDAVIGFDPQPPPEGLEEVYQSLLGREPDTNDAAVLCSDLAEWVTQNSSRFRTVVTRTNMVFGSDITLEDLKTALEPALTDDPLDSSLLNKQLIVDQAALYATVEPLFTGEEDPTRWEQFTATYETVSELYPNASEIKQMQPYADGHRVPEQTLVADQIDAAETLRTTKLQRLYEQLANTQTPTEDRETLQADITDVLAESEFEATLSEIESTFEAVSVEALRELAATATEQEEPLAEAPLADPAVRSQAETVAAGRALLGAEIDGDSLYEELQAVYEALQDDHETSFATEQLGRAIDGTAIPDPDRAKRLLSQGKSLLDSDDDDEELEEPDALDQLWQQVTAHDEGTIVVIDTEADQ